MSEYLGIAQKQLEEKKGFWTAKEICQQPDVWVRAHKSVDSNRKQIDEWLEPILAKPNLRIVLSGAGTSAFIGETLAPWMTRIMKRRIDALSTTDLVSDPSQYLAEDVPTLMISFARSGDSPESVASIQLADQVLSDCDHLFLTCNPEGYLAKTSLKHDRALCLLMPEETNDKSFAMTSSYSSMLVSCAAIFTPDFKQLEMAASLANKIIEEKSASIKSLAGKDFNRLVVLGAGCLQGTAREAALKCLELTAGEVVPNYDTPLGFRHGPKSIVDNKTMIIHFQSSEPYVSLYDNDLATELQGDKKAGEIVLLSPASLGVSDMGDLWLSLPYIVYCQILAFYKAVELNISADNPCPSGEVNRVVKGVTIHPYKPKYKAAC